MKHFGPPAATVAVCAALSASTLFATSFVVPADQELVRQSTAIVIAQVLESHSQKADGGPIETVTTISVEEVLKGSITSSTIDLHELGGVYEGHATIVPGVPRFHDGERVLLFLTRFKGNWSVWFLALGKFRFDTDVLGHEVLVRDLADAHAWNGDGTPHQEQRRRATAFLQFVRGAVAGGPANDDYLIHADPLIGDAGPQPFSGGRLKPAALAFTANSYTFVVNGSEGARWIRPIVSYFRTGSASGAPSDGDTGIVAAMQSWVNDGSSNISLNYVGLDGSGMHTGGIFTPDGQNTIAMEQDLNAKYGYPGFTCGASSYSGLLGLGGFSDAGPSTHEGPLAETFVDAVEGDVEMNSGTGTCAPFISSGDFNTSLAHEIGHTLGFRHSDENRDFSGACSGTLECSLSAVMKAFVPSGLNASLQTWDQHAAAAVYPNPTGNIPSNVVATAMSTTSVQLTWTAAAGASSYHVYRTADFTDWFQAGTPATNAFTDTGLAPNTAYFYLVRSFNGTAESADSNRDIATTVIFTDPTLTAGVTPIKAVHLTQLRTAVNAVRILGQFGAFSFTDPTLDSSVTVKAIHLTELRDALDPARANLGLPPLSYTDPTPTAGTTIIKAVHINELRTGVQ